MKIHLSIALRRCRQRGSAVMVFLILLAIMMLLATANSSALLHLRHELNLLDHRQIVRLNAVPTNITAVAVSPEPLKSK
jgi:hypothetical protein